jgi:hypothetical protein
MMHAVALHRVRGFEWTRSGQRVRHRLPSISVPRGRSMSHTNSPAHGIASSAPRARPPTMQAANPPSPKPILLLTAPTSRGTAPHAAPTSTAPMTAPEVKVPSNKSPSPLCHVRPVVANPLPTIRLRLTAGPSAAPRLRRRAEPSVSREGAASAGWACSVGSSRRHHGRVLMAQP